MKNKIYLTQEGKEEIEQRINQINEDLELIDDYDWYHELIGRKSIYTDILFNTVVIPKLDYETSKEQRIKFQDFDSFNDAWKLLDDNILRKVSFISINSNNLTITLHYFEKHKIK